MLTEPFNRPAQLLPITNRQLTSVDSDVVGSVRAQAASPRLAAATTTPTRRTCAGGIGGLRRPLCRPLVAMGAGSAEFGSAVWSNPSLDDTSRVDAGLCAGRRRGIGARVPADDGFLRQVDGGSASA